MIARRSHRIGISLWVCLLLGVLTASAASSMEFQVEPARESHDTAHYVDASALSIDLRFVQVGATPAAAPIAPSGDSPPPVATSGVAPLESDPLARAQLEQVREENAYLRAAREALEAEEAAKAEARQNRQSPGKWLFENGMGLATTLTAGLVGIVTLNWFFKDKQDERYRRVQARAAEMKHEAMLQEQAAELDTLRRSDEKMPPSN